MKPRFVAAFLFAIVAIPLSGVGQEPELLSRLDASAHAPAGGSGDSWAPIISADGRYVLFASTANNLLLAANGNLLPPQIRPVLNVFLRDRTNGTTALISVNVSGLAGGNGDSLPAAISTNGQFALFESSASDVVPGDTNNASDIFVRDLGRGSTTLISASTNGYFGNGASRDAVMTPDGHYVAFVSEANNLVARDTNRIADVFVRDVQAGTTVLASAGAVSTNSSLRMGGSEAPEITPDGRYVAFYSTATNLVAGVRAGGDVYVRDLVNNATIWASTGAQAAVLANLGSSSAVSYNQAISADGQFVAYEASRASNPGPNYSGLILRYSLATGLTDLVHTNAALGAGAYQDLNSIDLSADGQRLAFVANTNGVAGTTACVCVWDAASGGVIWTSTGLDGTVPAYSMCDFPVLSANGRFVAFLSSATNLVTNVFSGAMHLFVGDLGAGVTTLVDADTNGLVAPRGSAIRPSLSADGGSIAFDEADGNLVSDDRNRDADVFVHDLASGGTEMISGHDRALGTVTPNGLSLVGPGALSADGHYLAFSSDADNLEAGDTNACRDVFIRDLIFESNVLVSAGMNGGCADGPSMEASLSADGRYVVFTSAADNLVPTDTNKNPDVFVRDLQSGTTTLVSIRTDGGQANGGSSAPVISANGRWILFRSRATNLGTGLFQGENAFLRDMQSGVTYALNGSGALAAALTPDGRYAAVWDGSLIAPKLYIFDSLAGQRVYTNTSSVTPAGLGISPDGTRLAYWLVSGPSTSTLCLLDWRANTARYFTNSSGATLRPVLRFSQDSQTLVYNQYENSTNQVWCFDFNTDSNVRVSTGYVRTRPGDGDSDSPDVSADGRFIVYRSAAANLVPGDTNGVPNIFLFDRQTGSNTLLSANALGFSGNNRSLMPVSSPDGYTLCFASWASDLAGQDYNHYSDVFAFRFLYALILPGSDPAHGPWLSWPAVSGRDYGVQFKDSLAEQDWHELSVTITNQGAKAWAQDPGPANSQRFYRITSH